MYVKEIMFWNPSTYHCEIGKYLQSIIGDAIVICDEIIEVTNTIPTKLFQQKLFQQKLYHQILTKKDNL